MRFEGLASTADRSAGAGAGFRVLTADHSPAADGASTLIAGMPDPGSAPPHSATRFASHVPADDPCGNDRAPENRRPPPELDCLRGILTGQVLAIATEQAERTGVGADRVLIAAGVIDEETYLRRLAHSLDVAIESFAGIERRACPLPDDRLGEAAAAGLIPIRCENELIWILAPRGFAARRLCTLFDTAPALARRVRLTSEARLHAFISMIGESPFARSAADGLTDRMASFSAAPRPGAGRKAGILGGSLAAALTAVIFPARAFETLAAILALWFLAFIALRVIASFVPKEIRAAPERLPDSQLPVYTVIAALYHEASSVPGLVQALLKLDYPTEKLDIKLAVEPDDLETRAAIARLDAIPNLQVVIAPNMGPRTKPKALNAALTYARGTFTVIYDAEDRPEPNQLRTALDAFRQHGPNLACAQASLCIDNASDSWLSRMFTAEYAGQFDVFLPGFAAFHLPLPLGGSSNHFRTSILRAVAGWDAYNVTEDADLGVRLARFGYRTVTFASTTYEEAPAELGAWLRQRTRWMKGWMQTWAVHMRAPRQLWRDLGARGFLALNVAVGGNVLTALVHPLFAIMVGVEILLHGKGESAWLLAGPLAGLHGTAVVSGYAATVLIGMLGLRKRGLLRSVWVLALTPIYWLLLSAAAWRALHQYVTDRYRWEKTTHGLARSSHFIGPATSIAATDDAADRPPRPRSAA